MPVGVIVSFTVDPIAVAGQVDYTQFWLDGRTVKSIESQSIQLAELSYTEGTIVAMLLLFEWV